MPLLPAERCVFPDDLLTAPLGARSGRWWVLHTRSRSEKILVRRIQGHAVSFFLPLHRNQWRSRGRLLASYVPLFPGYVFLHGDDTARLRALETNLVAHCLPVPDQRQLHDDLARVHRLMACDAPLTPELGLRPGSRVRIVAGALAGLEGRVLRQGKQLKLLVEVHFLQQGVSVEVESWMLQPLDRPERARA